MKLYFYYSIYGYSNIYFIGNTTTKEAILIDPAEVTPAMINQIESAKYHLSAVLVTHNHVHHVRGLKTLLKIYPVSIYSANTKILGHPCTPLTDGEIFEVAGFSIEALCVPGHSPDSIIYRIDDLLFTGDALHAGLIGSALSPYNSAALAERLQRRILALSDEAMIFPGHGPPSTIGTERRFNVGLKPEYSKRITKSYDFFI